MNTTKPHSNEEVEKLAEQLHIWYLEAVQQDGSKYNPDAVVPYKDLPEGSKLLDRYIASKILAQKDEEIADARSEERTLIETKFHECCRSHNGNPTALQLAACTQLALTPPDQTDTK